MDFFYALLPTTVENSEQRKQKTFEQALVLSVEFENMRKKEKLSVTVFSYFVVYAL